MNFLNKIEKITGIDLDGDGTIGGQQPTQPAPAAPTMAQQPPPAYRAAPASPSGTVTSTVPKGPFHDSMYYGYAQRRAQNQTDTYDCIDIAADMRVPGFHNDKMSYAFIGVYDGHGGRMCAQAARSELRGVIVNSNEFKTGNYRGALADGYAKFDDRYLARPTRDRSGCSACTLLFTFSQNGAHKIYVANIGNTQAVMFHKKGTGVVLTKEHYPTNPDERARLVKADKFGKLKDGRLGTLEVSRAFGCPQYKTEHRDFLSVEPHLHEHIIQPDDGLLLIATAPFFKYVRAEEACQSAERLLAQQSNNIYQVCDTLANTAQSRGCQDDITILIVEPFPAPNSANAANGTIPVVFAKYYPGSTPSPQATPTKYKVLSPNSSPAQRLYVSPGLRPAIAPTASPAGTVTRNAPAPDQPGPAFRSGTGGSIMVHVLSGRELRGQAQYLLSDPYVVVSSRNYQWSTSVQHEKLNPVWDEKRAFPLYPSDDSIEFTVYDHGPVGTTEMGRAYLPISQINTRQGPRIYELPLSLNGMAAGTLNVEIAENKASAAVRSTMLPEAEGVGSSALAAAVEQERRRGEALQDISAKKVELRALIDAERAKLHVAIERLKDCGAPLNTETAEGEYWRGEEIEEYYDPALLPPVYASGYGLPVYQQAPAPVAPPTAPAPSAAWANDVW